MVPWLLLFEFLTGTVGDSAMALAGILISMNGDLMPTGAGAVGNLEAALGFLGHIGRSDDRVAPALGVLAVDISGVCLAVTGIEVGLGGFSDQVFFGAPDAEVPVGQEH
jgi:hypothetical protein